MQVFITFYCVVAELERYMCVVGWRRRGGCTETFGPVLLLCIPENVEFWCNKLFHLHTPTVLTAEEFDILTTTHKYLSM